MAKKKKEVKSEEIKIEPVVETKTPGFQKVKITEKKDLMRLQAEAKLYDYNPDTCEAIIRV